MDRAEQIKMIRGHVAQGQRHVASQRDVIKRLAELGSDTRLAEDLLEEFEVTLAEHERHLAQLLGEHG
jgi:uncharacterized coiled-coil protein SlyX